MSFVVGQLWYYLDRTYGYTTIQKVFYKTKTKNLNFLAKRESKFSELNKPFDYSLKKCAKISVMDNGHGLILRHEWVGL